MFHENINTWQMSSEKERGLKIHANVIILLSSYHVKCKELSAGAGISSTVLSGLDNLDTYTDPFYKNPETHAVLQPWALHNMDFY